MSDPVDSAHLERITHHDPQLQHELLALFSERVAGELARLGTASAAERSEIAHRLAGSARAIGAWEVARIATELGTGRQEFDAVSADLATAVANVQLYIEGRLSVAPGGG